MYEIFNIIGSAFGYLLWFLFQLVNNYGVAIILFTVILKIIILPSVIHQQKSMAKSSKLAVKQKELQKKYANDKNKLNEEISKLYQKEGVSPLGGCLPQIVPMLLLLGVYYSVIMPLTNTMHIPADTVNNAVGYLNSLPGIGTSFGGFYGQIDIIKLSQTNEGITYLNQFFDANTIKEITHLGNGFDFLGLDLLGKPNDGFSNLLLIPILCLVSSVGSQFYMMKTQSAMQTQQGCMKYTLLLLPLITAGIAYSVPAAVGLYWIISTVIGFAQSVLMQKFYNADIINANDEARHIALLEVEEAKVKYDYNPKVTNTNVNNNTKKKKKK